MNQAIKALSKGGKSPVSVAVQADIVAAVLARHMAITSKVEGRTKRTAVRLAIVASVQAGELSPGDVLPSEKILPGIMGVSLGTVQAALRQLQEVGLVVRRRGDGSRIACGEPLTRSIWHFRFADKSDGTPLRIIEEDVWIDTVTQTGDWSLFIGDCTSYLRIRRKLIMQNGTRAGAEMFFKTEAAPGLENIDPNELGMTSIRPYLEEKFGIATAGATHFVRTVSIDAETARIFGLKPHENVFEIHAKAYSHDHTPVYFQRIYVSADECALNF